MSVTINDVDFGAFARQITGEGSPSDKGKTVQTCLAALKKYQQSCGSEAVQKANSMEVLGLLIAQGAKGNPVQKEQAKKIAEALIGTKLFENASHAVRNNIRFSFIRHNRVFCTKN